VSVISGPGRGPRASLVSAESARAPSRAARVAQAVAAVEAGVLGWRDRYARYLAATDLFVILWAVAGAHLVRASFAQSTGAASAFAPRLLISSQAIVVLWMVVLSIVESRDAKIIGLGSDEYKRVGNATFVVFAIVAMGSYLFHLDLPRSYLLIVMPAGLLGLVIDRWVWRRWLQIQRDRAEYSATVLAVGNVATVRELISELRRAPRAGYRVVGACVSGGDELGGATHILGVPVVGSLGQVVDAVGRTGADTVAVTATASFGPSAVRRLSWDLEKTSAELILAPALTDIAGPRIQTQPVAGLSLIHVERPTYRGATKLFKTAFDLVGAGLLLLMLSPVFLAIALGIKVTSPGPVFFRQERVGLDGERFKMIKFRSMRVDAEAMLEQLQAEQRDAGNDVLFKIKNDPRVTSIGKFIRRFSLDEIPQLLNVLRGEMSLVGPRPPLVAEVARYEDEVHRRLLVKPGMTGLWQVSGRSDLSWDETVRLDLSYVENWSIASDLVILFKTAKAVVAPEGAY